MYFLKEKKNLPIVFYMPDMVSYVAFVGGFVISVTTQTYFFALLRTSWSQFWFLFILCPKTAQYIYAIVDQGALVFQPMHKHGLVSTIILYQDLKVYQKSMEITVLKRNVDKIYKSLCLVVIFRCFSEIFKVLKNMHFLFVFSVFEH